MSKQSSSHCAACNLKKEPDEHIDKQNTVFMFGEHHLWKEQWEIGEKQVCPCFMCQVGPGKTI